MNIANFKVDHEKCISCKLCTKVCPNNLIYLNEQNKVCHKSIDVFGWDGCWKCQHCMAVCPKGAISILDKNPKNSLLPYEVEKTSAIMDSLVVNRRSHRRYLRKNVDNNLIMHIFSILQNAPNGGNKQQVQYTLINDIEQMDYLRKIAYNRMEQLAKQGIYAKGYDQKSYNQLKEAEKSVRPDMLFCGVPHLLIPHTPIGKGCWQQDTAIACTYFELLCNAHGLAAIFMSYCLDVLNLMPDIKSLLNIPDNHYISMAVGFGYPEIKYARGVQKETELKLDIINIKDKYETIVK